MATERDDPLTAATKPAKQQIVKKLDEVENLGYAKRKEVTEGIQDVIDKIRKFDSNTTKEQVAEVVIELEAVQTLAMT